MSFLIEGRSLRLHLEGDSSPSRIVPTTSMAIDEPDGLNVHQGYSPASSKGKREPMKATRTYTVLLLLMSSSLSAQECIGWPGGPVEGSIAVQHQRVGDSRGYGLELAGQIRPNVGVALSGSTFPHFDRMFFGVDEVGQYLGQDGPSHAIDLTLTAGPFSWACLTTGYSRIVGWKIQKSYVDQFGRIIGSQDEEELDIKTWSVPAGFAFGRSLGTGPLSVTPHFALAYVYSGFESSGVPGRLESDNDHDWAGSAGFGVRYEWLAGRVTILRSLRHEDAETWVELSAGAHLP